MADENALELTRHGESLFRKKDQLLTLWQTLAEEVYQARANFTVERIDGDEFMYEQYESVPSQNRRDFAYAMGALSRPKSQTWFDMKARDEMRNTDAAKAWLGMARDKQYTLLYSRRANFQRAMQMGDNDFVTFGNAVHSILEDDQRSRLPVYDTHHLRDCAWFEDKSRQVVGMYRKFKLSFANWSTTFRGVPLPQQYKDRADKNPHDEIELWHVSMPIGHYDFYKKRVANKRHKYASIYIDPTTKTIIKEAANFEFPYIVRRWVLLDNSQYAHSPAAMYGIIDARLLQAQSRVILEAGERVIDPPMVAKAEGVLGKINNYPGATNWVDANYDERHGEALRALNTEANIPLGLEMKQDTRQVHAAAWFLNKLNLPSDKDMTAFEVNERISEYIRSIGPAIEPFQDDNATLLDASFTMNLRFGNFGPLEAVPPELHDADVTFEFEGPMQVAYKRQKLNHAREVIQLATSIVAMNPTHPPEALDNIDFDALTRDAVDFIGKEPGWLKNMQAVQGKRQAEMEAMAEQQAAAKAQQAMAGVGQAADLAPKLAAANQAIPLITGGSTPEASPFPEQEDTSELEAA
jgi:hypothetical protein